MGRVESTPHYVAYVHIPDEPATRDLAHEIAGLVGLGGPLEELLEPPERVGRSEPRSMQFGTLKSGGNELVRIICGRLLEQNPLNDDSVLRKRHVLRHQAAGRVGVLDSQRSLLCSTHRACQFAHLYPPNVTCRNGARYLVPSGSELGWCQAATSGISCRSLSRRAFTRMNVSATTIPTTVKIAPTSKPVDQPCTRACC
jgi:hypothetical protein